MKCGRTMLTALALLLATGATAACTPSSDPGLTRDPLTSASGTPGTPTGTTGTPGEVPASPATDAGPAGGTTSAAGVTSTAGSRPGVAPGGDLRGTVIAIDPGHNGSNGRNPSVINAKVRIGNGSKACDTTGTETNAGFPESAFTFDVAQRLAELLRARGATVVLTRSSNRGVGPCITERAAVGNRSHADAAISIHGDGARPSGFGFHVIVPRGIGSNDAIVAPSRRLGVAVRDAFRAGTGESLSTYTGTTTGGIVTRDDLGGLNLSQVPKVFIECGNMRNAADARRMTSPAWRQQAAVALAQGLARFLTTH